MKLQELKTGDIIEFVNGYYTDSYIASVIKTTQDYVVVSIPHGHSLKMDNETFSYHKKRMKKIGTIEDKSLVLRLHSKSNGKPTKNLNYLSEEYKAKFR